MSIEFQKFKFDKTYRNTFRAMFFDKLSIHNTYMVPQPRSACVFIDLKALEDFDSSRIIASVFILRLLSGRKPYVVRFGLFQTFHTKTYDAFVQVTLKGYALQTFLGVLSYSIMPFLTKVDFSLKNRLLNNGILTEIVISDLSFLRVVETHSVFFRWHDKIRVSLLFNTRNYERVDAFFSTLKFL